MRKFAQFTATSIAIAGLVVTPAATAASSHSHRGQHGNHCGLGHVKHTHAQGRTCVKTNHQHS